MRKLSAAVCALVILALHAGEGWAQVPVVTEGPIQVSVTGRAQPQFNTTSVDGAEAYSTFEMRRARLGLDLLVDGWIEGRVEADFAHGVRLENAYANLVFHEAFQLQAGQFKKPFSRLELTSSTKIVPIERGLRIRDLPGALAAEHAFLLDENLYVGRELGAQVHGVVGPLYYAAGAFNGSAQNARDDNDAKSYAARLNLAPFDAPFEIGAAASWRDVSRPDTLGGTTTEEGLAVEVDAQWGGFRRPGLSLVAEVMQAKNFAMDDPMLGAQAVVSWFQPTGRTRIEGWEPLFRASWGDPSTEFEGNYGLLLTPGLNLYFHGRNRLMVNLDWLMPEDDQAFEPEHAIRTQLQLYF